MASKVLLVGGGAREHALAKALKKNGETVLFAFMKNRNPGIAALSKEVMLGSECDTARVTEFALSKGVDFAVVGPEAPLEAGVADALEEKGVPCVGPGRELARLETSKAFARTLLEEHGIPGNPEFEVFESIEGVPHFVKKLFKEKAGFVVKPDGLTGGKGVKVFGEHLHTEKEAIDYCREVLRTHASVIVEEKLEGEEFSLQCLVSGSKVVATPLVQDHKRAFEGDSGPNTGGMGSYSDSNHLLPFLEKTDFEQAVDVCKQTAKAILKETGKEFGGVLYGGFMATRNGVKLLEYNVRFGDPEAMNVLPILEPDSDFTEICQKMVDGSLKEESVQFQKKATVVKYLVPAGYPEKPNAGDVITVDKKAFDEVNTQLFYAAVNEEDGVIKTTTSRAIGVLGIGESLEEAEQRAESAVKAVKGNLRYRKDIGTRTLIQKRVEHMKKLRG